MKKILLAVFLCLMLVGIANAQMNVKDASVEKFNVQLVPYVDLKLWANDDSPEPLARYGVRLEANNIFAGMGVYVALEGGEVDVKGENFDSTPNCTETNPCTWPNSWINRFEESKSYTAIFIGTQWKLKVFEK